MSQEEETKTPSQPEKPDQAQKQNPAGDGLPLRPVLRGPAAAVGLLRHAAAATHGPAGFESIHLKNQNVNELQLENQRLQYELEDQQEQSTQLEKQLEEKDKEAQALEWLRQIEAATRRSYTTARELAEAFEATGLQDSLPTESVVEGGDSPAETYESIHNMLF